MSLSYTIIPRPKLLHSFLSGQYSLEHSQQHFLEIMNYVKAHCHEKILIDGRGVIGEPTVMERFQFGEFVAHAVNSLKVESIEPLNPQFAYVLSEPTFDPLHFGETVAVNRGMNVKTFDKIDEAIEWLGLTPEDLHEDPS